MVSIIRDFRRPFPCLLMRYQRTSSRGTCSISNSRRRMKRNWGPTAARPCRPPHPFPDPHGSNSGRRSRRNGRSVGAWNGGWPVRSIRKSSRIEAHRPVHPGPQSGGMEDGHGEGSVRVGGGQPQSGEVSVLRQDRPPPAREVRLEGGRRATGSGYLRRHPPAHPPGRPRRPRTNRRWVRLRRSTGVQKSISLQK